MNRMHWSFTAVVLAVVAVSTPVHAASNRTFVASYGNDANAATNCALGAPCRTFAGALTATNAGGEILALDSAGFGPVTIDRSVSITGPDGVYAGITVTSGNGVTVSTAGVKVALKGLSINGVGGANGIFMTDGASLRIENCTVSGFTTSATAGITIIAPARVVISNTTATGNNAGIVIDGGANADISRVKAVGNNHGIALMGTSNGTAATTTVVVSDSIASGNTVYGLAVLGQGTSVNPGGFGTCASCSRKLTVVNAVASGNNFGMAEIGTGATMNVSSSVASNNFSNGLFQFGGGTLRSALNNVLTDNPAGPTSGAITPGGMLF